MDLMQCPNCGKMFDPNTCVLGENGNPVCPECCIIKEKEEEEE